MHPLDIHWVYTFGSVALVAGISLTGMVALSLSPQRLSRLIPLLVSLAAGALLGTAFGHLLPESVERVGSGRKLSGLLLAGFVTFFVLERFLCVWCNGSSHHAGGANSHHHHGDVYPTAAIDTHEHESAAVNRPMVTNL